MLRGLYLDDSIEVVSMHKMRTNWEFNCTYGFRRMISLSGYELGLKLYVWVVGVQSYGIPITLEYSTRTI